MNIIILFESYNFKYTFDVLMEIIKIVYCNLMLRCVWKEDIKMK